MLRRWLWFRSVLPGCSSPAVCRRGSWFRPAGFMGRGPGRHRPFRAGAGFPGGDGGSGAARSGRGPGLAAPPGSLCVLRRRPWFRPAPLVVPRRPRSCAGRGFGLCCRVVPRPLGAGVRRGFGLCWELFLLYWVPACAMGAGERSDAGLPGWARRGGRKGGVGGNLAGGPWGRRGKGSLPGFPPLPLILLLAWLPVCALLLFPTSVAPLAVGVRSGRLSAAFFARLCRQPGQQRPGGAHSDRTGRAAFGRGLCGRCAAGRAGVRLPCRAPRVPGRATGGW